MKIFILVFLLNQFISQLAYAAKYDIVNKGRVNVIAKEDLPLLKEVPEPTLEEITWFSQALAKTSAENFMKGKILNINVDSDYKQEIIFYKDKLKKNPSLRKLYNQGLHFDGKAECMGWRPEYWQSGTRRHCGGLKCDETKGERMSMLGNSRPKPFDFYDSVKDLTDIKFDEWDKLKCPYMDNVAFTFEDNGQGFSFVIKELDQANGVASILLGNDEYYIDLSLCKKKNCFVVTKEHSDYDYGQVQLFKRQRAKNDPELEYFIKELLPCVKKKDRACILKFFVTLNDLKKFAVRNDTHTQTEISDNDIEELEACLRYESLLLHRLAYRGIKKGCLLISEEDYSILTNRKKFLVIGEPALIRDMSRYDTLLNTLSILTTQDSSE